MQVEDAARELAAQYVPFSRYTENALREALQPLTAGNLAAQPLGLDVGSGTGVPGEQVLRVMPRARLWAVDCSEEMLEHCAEAGIYERCLRAEASDLPLRSECVDFALSVHAFHLFPDKPAALVEMARVTKQGGLILLVTNVPEDLDSQLFHQLMPRFRRLEAQRHFDRDDVDRWASRAGLDLLEVVRSPFSVVFEGREELVDFLASRPFFGLRLLTNPEFAADLAHCRREAAALDEAPLHSRSALTTFVLRRRSR